jgi:glutamate dehydrogenase
MTDEVADLVLTNTFRQAQALSLALRHSRSRGAEYQRFVTLMEQTADLDRELESIPADEALSERFTQGQGLTRPELAVLLAYAKIYLKQELIESDIHTDPLIARMAHTAFPPTLRARFEGAIADHPLSQQLIATQLANDLVHHLGITFVSHLGEFIGSSPDETVLAYLAAMESFQIRESFRAIEALEGASEEIRLTLMLEQLQLGRRATRWLLRHRRGQLVVHELVEQFRERVDQLRTDAPRMLGQLNAARLAADAQRLAAAGVADEFAARYGSASLLAVALPVIDAADRAGADVMQIVDVYTRLASALSLDWLVEQLVQLTAATHWQSMERDALLDDVTTHLGRLATRVVREQEDPLAVGEWISAHPRFSGAWRAAVEAAQHAAVQDFSLFSMTCRKLNDLCTMLSAVPIQPQGAPRSVTSP